MEKRIIEFVAGLRAAGVRVSIAESEDAFQAVRRLGILNQADFREALRATLIKNVKDETLFAELFPLYFNYLPRQPVNLLEKLSPEEQRLLLRAVQTLLGQLSQSDDPGDKRVVDQFSRPQDLAGKPSADQVRNLTQMLRWLLAGQAPGQDAFTQAEQQLGQQGNLPVGREWQWWYQRRLLQQLGSQLLPKVQQPLPDMLRNLGMKHRSITDIMASWEANLEILTEQAAEQAELIQARQWAEQQVDQARRANELLHRALQNLNERETTLLRQEMRRLVAQLRSQIALRQKRAKRGTPDIRKTLRSNLRYGGVPIDLKFKTKTQKPRLLLLCDISNSMRKVVEFALRLVYELQDQVSGVRTFTYIDTIAEISQLFAQSPPDIAITQAVSRLPAYYPNTDLGKCLDMLLKRHRDAIDRRITVIIVGDACNSWNDPRLDLMAEMQRLSKAIIWLNPREASLWDMNDSDMLKYLPYASAVHHVSTMAELALAIDNLLTVG